MPAAGLPPKTEPGGGVAAPVAHHGARPAKVPLRYEKVFHLQERQMMRPATVTRVPDNCQAHAKRPSKKPPIEYRAHYSPTCC